MRRTIAVLAIIAGANAQAEEAWIDTCTKISDLAYQIMEYRQNGNPMSQAMKIADGDKYLGNIIVAAYEVPRYSTESLKKRKAEELRDEAFLGCMKSNPED